MFVRLLATTLFLLCGLAGCGFHLRTLQQELPFKTVSVGGDNEIARLLRQRVELLEGTRLSGDPKQAEARIAVLGETLDRRIIALTPSGKVAEYQLRYRVEFAVYDAGDDVLQAPAEIEVRGEFPYDGQTLAKEAEERQLVEHLRQQAADTLLRRVSALHNRTLQAPDL